MLCRAARMWPQRCARHRPNARRCWLTIKAEVNRAIARFQMKSYASTESYHTASWAQRAPRGGVTPQRNGTAYRRVRLAGAAPFDTACGLLRMLYDTCYVD